MLVSIFSSLLFSDSVKTSNNNNNGPVIPTAPKHAYSRDEFLALADSALSRAVPEDLARVAEDIPGLGRNLGCPASVDKVCLGLLPPTNPDWHALFGVEGAVTSAVAAVCAANGGQAEEKRPKKNFLEVLRPNAPTRTWDDVLGEWVEAPTPLMDIRVGGAGHAHGRA